LERAVRGSKARYLPSALAILLLAAQLAAALPPTETPHYSLRVEVVGLLEPNERAKAILHVSFAEAGAYGALLYVAVPVKAGDGRVGWRVVGEGELGADVYEKGSRRVEVEFTVPGDVYCGFPPYAYAVLFRATERGVVKEYFTLPLGAPACALTTVGAVQLWEMLGGLEGARELTSLLERVSEELERLRGENERLAEELANAARRISSLEEEKSSLQSVVERQTAEIAGLRERLNAAQREIERREQRVKALEAENAQLKTGLALAAAAAVAVAVAAILTVRRKR